MILVNAVFLYIDHSTFKMATFAFRLASWDHQLRVWILKTVSGFVTFRGDTFRTALFRNPSFPSTEKRVKLHTLSCGRHLLFLATVNTCHMSKIWDRAMGYSAILTRKPDTARPSSLYCSYRSTAPAAEHWWGSQKDDSSAFVLIWTPTPEEFPLCVCVREGVCIC